MKQRFRPEGGFLPGLESHNVSEHFVRAGIYKGDFHMGDLLIRIVIAFVILIIHNNKKK